jgi:hypothetical protein
MSTPVFQREDTKVNGVFTSDRAKLKFANGVSGVLVQGVNFNYSQAVTRLYEIGSSDGGDFTNIYYVGGRTQGQAGLNRVVGPQATITAMYSTYGNVCNACNNPMELQLNEVDCCSNTQVSLVYTLKYVVLVMIGISIQAMECLINEQSQLMFSGCDYNSSGV